MPSFIMLRDLLREGERRKEPLRVDSGVVSHQGQCDDAVRIRSGGEQDQSISAGQDHQRSDDRKTSVAGEDSGKNWFPSGVSYEREASSETPRVVAEADEARESITRQECGSCRAWHIKYGCLLWWKFHTRIESGRCKYYDKKETT